jgi:hypothetical protein
MSASHLAFPEAPATSGVRSKASNWFLGFGVLGAAMVYPSEAAALTRHGLDVALNPGLLKLHDVLIGIPIFTWTVKHLLADLADGRRILGGLLRRIRSRTAERLANWEREAVAWKTRPIRYYI